MPQLIYVLQFQGSAGPVEGQEGVMQARTHASSAQVTTTIGPNGVSGSIAALDGAGADFESEVRFTGETSFLENGTIRFGEAGSLTFSTVGSGYLAPAPEGDGMAGSIIWKIDSGEGQLAGASGLITSNFTVSSSGEVVDNHVGLIYLK
jgi:hypothetical protein